MSINVPHIGIGGFRLKDLFFTSLGGINSIVDVPLSCQPEWASNIPGRRPAMKRLMSDSGCNAAVLMLEYDVDCIAGPSDVVSVISLHVVDADDYNTVFDHMDGLWRQIKEDNAHRKHVTISDVDGKMVFGIGFPDQREFVQNLSCRMLDMKRKWDLFKNETDFESVQKMYAAKQDIDILKRRHRGMLFELEQIRGLISEKKRDLANLERHMNGLFENAASAMNLLEEHGYPQELKYDDKGVLVDDVVDDSDLTVTDPNWANYITTSSCSPHHPILLRQNEKQLIR